MTSERLTILKLFIWCLVALCCTLSACSTSKTENGCTLDQAHAPEIHGLHLGMTLDEFKTHVQNPNVSYPAINIPAPDKFGVISLSEGDYGLLNSSHSAADLAHIEINELVFIDNRLAHIMVKYVDETKWNSLAEFKPKIAQSFNLPDAWKKDTDLLHMEISPLIQRRHYNVWNDEYLDCNGFRIVIGFTAKNVFHTSYGTSGEIHRPFVRLTDLKAIQMVETRQVQRETEEKEKQRRQEEEQRGTFRP
jgi:hypothetical protein